MSKMPEKSLQTRLEHLREAARKVFGIWISDKAMDYMRDSIPDANHDQIIKIACGLCNNRKVSRKTVSVTMVKVSHALVEDIVTEPQRMCK